MDQGRRCDDDGSAEGEPGGAGPHAAKPSARGARFLRVWARASSSPSCVELGADGRPRGEYEAARARVLIAQACRALGDHDGADIDLDAASPVFEESVAAPDLTRLSDLAGVAGGAIERLDGAKIECSGSAPCEGHHESSERESTDDWREDRRESPEHIFTKLQRNASLLRRGGGRAAEPDRHRETGRAAEHALVRGCNWRERSSGSLG